MRGKIYLLSNSVDDMVYVGSTVQKLKVRLSMHRAAARAGIDTRIYEHMRKIAGSKWTIEAIKIKEVENRRELEKLEFHCMKKYPVEQLLNMNTVYGKRSAESRRKMSLSHSGRRGFIGRYIQNDKVTYLVRFFWQHWENDISKQKSKSFSVKKYGERGAMKLAEAFRDTIYPPITE